MKKTNFHTHTKLCRHAGGTEEDYIKEALRQHLDIIGFSDHAPYPDDRLDMRMAYAELIPHIQKLKDLRVACKDRIEIRIGLEIEYDPAEHDYYHYLLHDLGIEYLLLGQHVFRTKTNKLMNTYFIEQTGNTDLYLDYALSLKEGMESGLFAAVAHPDLVFINNLPLDENAEEACRIIIDAAQKTGTVLEFNANGLRRGKTVYPEGIRYPYPHNIFWERLSDTNHPVIVGADCHNPYKLWDENTVLAYEKAEKLRLHIIETLL